VLFISDFLAEAGFKVLEATGADEARSLLQVRPE